MSVGCSSSSSSSSKGPEESEDEDENEGEDDGVVVFSTLQNDFVSFVCFCWSQASKIAVTAA